MESGQSCWFEVFQVDNGKFRFIEGMSNWQARHLREYLQTLIVREFEQHGIRLQTYPTLVFFADDGGVLHDTDLLSDFYGRTDESRNTRKIIMFNLSACVDEEQQLPFIADVEELGIDMACAHMREDLEYQLIGLGIAESSLGNKLTKDLDTVQRAVGLLTGDVDGQDFTVLNCGTAIEQLFNVCPVVHKDTVEVVGSENRPLISYLEGKRIDFSKLQDLQKRRAQLLESLQSLNVELKDILAATKPDFASEEVTDQAKNLVAASNIAYDVEYFSELASMKSKMCSNVISRLDTISKNQRRLRKAMYRQTSFGEIAKKVNHIKSACRELSSLSRMPASYIIALREMRRQRKFDEAYRESMVTLRNHINKMRESEIDRRQTFLRKHGKYLPDWDELQSLRSKPIHYLKHVSGEESRSDGLPNISEEMVAGAADAVEPVFEANPELSSSTGWDGQKSESVVADYYEPSTIEQVNLLQRIIVAVNAECGAAKQREAHALSEREHAVTSYTNLKEEYDALLNRIQSKIDQFSKDGIVGAVAHSRQDNPSEWADGVLQELLKCVVQQKETIRSYLEKERQLESAAGTSLSPEWISDLKSELKLINMDATTACNECSDVDDLSSWPGIIRRLSTTIEAQKTKLSQLEPEITNLTSTPNRLSSSSEKTSLGSPCTSVYESNMSNSTHTSGPISSTPMVSTGNFQIGSKAFFVPWNSKAEKKKGYIAFQPPGAKERYNLDDTCVEELHLATMTRPFVGEITFIGQPTDGKRRIKAKLMS